jgi:ATPase subunit of ABC transporter with duplicated ATPase domains
MAEFIYVMRRARKAHGDKVILDDVTLAMYPGAKIGVVGPNGAGKSSVLHIMAGLDQPSNGEAYLSPGYTVGILEQEPTLNEDKTVLGNVEEGVAETKATTGLTKPPRTRDRLLRRAARRDGQAAGAARSSQRMGSESQSNRPYAPRCPPRMPVRVLSGGERRRVAVQAPAQQPDLPCSTSPTISTPSRSSGSSNTEKYPGNRSPSPTNRYSTTLRSGSSS